MKKRCFAILLALCMALALFPVSAFAAEDEFVIEDGVLTKYNGSGGNVVIPDGVTSIRWDVFKGCAGLTSVTIPSGVTSIGEAAFYECTSLTSVTIPSSVTSIGSSAFAGCSRLTSVTIPDSVISIGANAFSGTPWQESLGEFAIVNGILLAYQGFGGDVSIPNSVTSIGGYAFDGCTGLTSVTIPDSVTSIGAGAFNCCTSLTRVTIPNSVTRIREFAFSGCSRLTSVTIPSSVTSIGGYAFYECTSLTRVTIPNSVTSIGEYTFYGCESLTRVTIPSSVTSIGDHAFSGCSRLISVTIPDSVTWIEYFAFRDCKNLTDVYYGGSKADWERIIINSGNTPLTGATIHYNSPMPAAPAEPDVPAGGLHMLGNWGWRYDSDTKTLYIVGSGEMEEDYSSTRNRAPWYSQRDEITAVIIDSGISSIGSGAFGDCPGLTSVTIPNSVTSIGSGAFASCAGLTSVTIPNSVTSIGGAAFADCRGLTSVIIPNSVTTIGDYAFSECYNLTSVTILGSVTSIGEATFSYCTSLTSVTIPSSVTSIGDYAFLYCPGLTRVTIPSSVTSIGELAFCGCESLTDVYYGGSQSQWDALDFSVVCEDENWGEYDRTSEVTIHYNSPMPATPAGPTLPAVENIPASGTAVETKQTIMLDGAAKEFQCYAIMDENGNGTNYIKIRDLALALNGTSAQFNVGWDGKISIQSGAAYQPNGSENSIAYTGNQAYESISSIAISFNGQDINLTAINIQGGNTYYKLRDLGQLLNFNVKWDAEAGKVAIESDQPYNPND